MAIEKGNLKDRIKNSIRIFKLNALKKAKLIKQKKELEQALLLEKKKKEELRLYLLYRSRINGRIKNKKIKVQYNCKITEYLEEVKKVGIGNTVRGNNNELLAIINYNSYGAPILKYVNPSTNYTNLEIKYLIKKQTGLNIEISNIKSCLLKNNINLNNNYEAVEITKKFLNNHENGTSKELLPTNFDIKKMINKFINNSKEEINNLRNDLNNLELEIQNAYKIEQTEKIKEKYLVLKQKIDDMIKKYQVIKDNSDFFDFDELNNSLLWEKIDYFKYFSSSNDIEQLAYECKSELEKMENIIYLYENKDIYDYDLDSKIQGINYRDDIYDKDKNNLKKLSYVEGQISDSLSYIKKQIARIESDVDRMNITVTTKNIVKGYNKLFTNVGKFALGILTLPFGKFSIGRTILGATLVNNAIRGIRNSLKSEEEPIRYISYTDYDNEIKKYSNNLDRAEYIIGDSLDQISKLKTDFKNKFQDYENIIPEYKQFFIKVNGIEEKFIKKQEEIKKYKEKLIEKDKKNRAKMKKIGEYMRKY